MVMQAYGKGLMIAVIPFTSKVLFLASEFVHFICVHFSPRYYFCLFDNCNVLVMIHSDRN